MLDNFSIVWEQCTISVLVWDLFLPTPNHFHSGDIQSLLRQKYEQKRLIKNTHKNDNAQRIKLRISYASTIIQLGIENGQFF